MGSGGALVSIDKMRRVLGFEAPVPFARACELTLQWARHSRADFRTTDRCRGVSGVPARIASYSCHSCSERAAMS